MPQEFLASDERSDAAGLENACSVTLPDKISALPAEQDKMLAELLETALQKARRNGFTARHFLSTFSGARYPDSAFEDIASMLNTDTPRLTPERVVCAWLLGVAPLRADHRQEAIRILKNLLQSSKSVSMEPIKRRLLRAMGRSYILSLKISFGAILLAGAILIFVGALPLTSLPFAACLAPFITILSAAFLCLPIYPIMLPFSLASDENRINSVRLMAARSLGRMGQIDGLGALAKACLEKNDSLRRVAESGLRSLLPLLTGAHFGQLGPELGPDLCRLLAQSDSRLLDAEGQAVSLSSELLEAIDKIGDSRAIPTVQQIFAAGRTEGLKAQANRILRTLMDRKKREQQQQTLLRGAGRPSSSTEHLLRAAAGPTGNGPDDLLRASRLSE